MTSSKEFFSTNADIEAIEAFVVDVNGVPRGKSLPSSSEYKLYKDGMRLPRSIYAVDIWGRDVLPAGLVAETGDNDGICFPVEGTLHRVPFLEAPTAQVLLSMRDARGEPFFGDPRNVLSRVLERYRAAGLKPVVALELEFYLLDSKRNEYGAPQPPLAPRTRRRSDYAHTYAIDEMEEFGTVLNEISKCCRAQGIPADTTISENGPGQYEINLNHVADALKAADYAFLMKRIVRGVARQHSLDATFMAKPYADCSGNGLHVHFSVLDSTDKNIFAGKDWRGSPELGFAIAGLMSSMSDSMAVFAPNFNSYRRFRAGSHAPTRIAWGYDNRSASLRIPESEIPATRIEHRVSGADAHPYLVLASILSAAFDGIMKRSEPVPALEGNVYQSNALSLPNRWDDALEAFCHSPFIAEYLGSSYQKLYLACKEQEKEEIESQVSSIEYNSYLRDI